MDEDLTFAVDDFRRRIGEQRREAERLQGIVIELEAHGAGGADERRAAASLRRARADLTRVKDEVAELARICARFRLREGLGRDPASVDDDIFDEELLAFCGGAPGGRTGRRPGEGAIAFATVRQLLLADLPLGELVAQAQAERRGGRGAGGGSEGAGTKAVLRRWAAMAQSDPYVSGALARSLAALERYHACLGDFQRGLDDLRVNYEIKHRGADVLAFHVEGERCVLRAENDWASMRAAFPQEAARLAERFHGLRQAHAELSGARGELNGELRDFLESFVAMYLTYVSRQGNERRRQLGVAGQNLRRLAHYLLEEIADLDCLQAGGGGLEVPLPRIPRAIVPFARTDAYRQLAGATERPTAEEGERDD